MPSLFQRNRVVLLHLSFWCAYLSFLFYQIIGYQRGPEFHWNHVIRIVSIQVVFAALISYLNYFYLQPRFLENKNVWVYLLEFSVPFALIMAVRIFVERSLADSDHNRYQEFLYTSRYLVQVLTTNLFIVIFVGMIRFAVDWFEFESRQKAAENEKLTAELNFLKAQINPHFLFNTLNNLYYLAYSQSPNTTEVIAKLSQMMRYMIYDSNHPSVPLSKEIEYMQNYISLEKLRLNSQVPIRFEIEGDTHQATIVPLIFITFLENAFKHGISSNYAGAWVNISIKIKGKECIYSVENSKVENVSAKSEKSGIGLQNVHRRLELSYPGRYELKTEEGSNRYFVQLKITLS